LILIYILQLSIHYCFFYCKKSRRIMLWWKETWCFSHHVAGFQHGVQLILRF